jgi:hypothetical protein
MYKVGKVAAGNVLNGCVWNEVPFENDLKAA